MTGELTDMQVTERVEHGTGRIIQPAKLTGKLSLKNTSSDQGMRMVGGTSYGSADRLDPGQASSHSLDAEFPAAALKAKGLKEARLELSFIPSQFREETLNFTVSIAGE